MQGPATRWQSCGTGIDRAVRGYWTIGNAPSGTSAEGDRSKQTRWEIKMLETGSTQQRSSSHVRSVTRPEAAVASIRLRRVPESRLLSFYLDLSFEQRLARFGIPSSDCAIRHWRSTIDRAHYLPITLEHGRHLVGLVELFGSRASEWRRPELAVTLGATGDSLRMRRHLLDIGLAAARDLGAIDVFTAFTPGDASAADLALRHDAKFDDDVGVAIIPCDLEDRAVSWAAASTGA